MMKQITVSGHVLSLFVLLVLVGCAAAPQGTSAPVGAPTLRGNWEGTRTDETGTKASAEMEIHNDTVPFKGRLVIKNVSVKGQAARTVVFEFDNGVVQSGNLFIKSGDDEGIELSLLWIEGKMGMRGSYSYLGARGTLSLVKK